MVGEIFAGIGAFKSMLDLAKSIKDMNDAAIRNGAVIDLQGQILSAQEAQAALVERIRTLEKEVADFETWEAEKQTYELKSLGWGSFAYVLKPDARGAKPPHWVCPNCFANKKISIIQHLSVGPKRGHWCPSCSTEFQPSQNLSLDEWPA